MSNEILEAVREHGEKFEKSLSEVKGVSDQTAETVRELADRVLGIEQKGIYADEAAFIGNGNKGAGLLPTFAGNEAVRKFAQERSIKSANVPINMPINLLSKAVLGDSGAEQYNVAPQRDLRLANVPGRRLSIFEVLPRLQAGSNTFEFNELDSAYANAAAYQATEGAGKASGAMPTNLKSVPICTIAHYFKLSEQVLADSPALQQQASNLLGYGVVAKASAEILAGSTVGKIQGLATIATAFASTSGASLADGIGEAMVALDIAGWQPNVAILHPSDWFAIRSERTATEGDYVANGWAGAAEQSLWGMRVVTDPAIAAGSPLVLDSTQVAILDRMQTRVEFGREGSDMTDNLVTALAECRIGLAVFAPSAIREVSLTA